MSGLGLPDKDSLIARRERSARVIPENETVAKLEEVSAAAPSAQRPTLEPKVKTPKAALSTRITANTDKRLQKFVARGGYAVTDVVELAIAEFLDRQGA